MSALSYVIHPISWTRLLPTFSTLRTGRSPVLVLALFLVFLCGCGSVSSSHNSAASPSNGFSISGSISPTSAAGGATLALSGRTALTTTANSSGNFSFAGLANGTYVVTPSRNGYAFNPASQTVTISGSNEDANFSASRQAEHSVVLSWIASTSTVSGYNVYRGSSNGGPYTKINPALVSLLTYTDSFVSSGNTYYYVSTSVDSAGKESSYSDQVTAVIP